MKITKTQLKQIIKEELGEISSVASPKASLREARSETLEELENFVIANEHANERMIHDLVGRLDRIEEFIELWDSGDRGETSQ